MGDLAKAAVPKCKPRKARGAAVTGRRQIFPDLVCLSMSSLAFVGKELGFTDHYAELLFMPEDADYPWPFDVAQIRAEQPRDKLPITRTYTLVNLDSETGDFDVDFATHSSSGLAGPWARVAKVGDKPSFSGPDSAWGPAAEYEHFVFADDESATPAIGASLEHFPESMTTTACIEVEAKSHKFKLPTREGVEIYWVLRNGATHGTKLSRTTREADIPEGKKTNWFIHGVAGMIKGLRCFLFVESEMPKKGVSISGYWRIGMTKDQWQSSKRGFNAEVETEEERARA